MAQTRHRLSGVSLLIGGRLEVGWLEPRLSAIELGLSILLMTFLGKWLNLSSELTSLLAIGSSICGVSAIIAAKGAIDADDEDTLLTRLPRSLRWCLQSFRFSTD